MKSEEASGRESRGFYFYRELNNRTLRGVLRDDVGRDKIVLPWVGRWFYARIAVFRQQYCSRLVLDEPITCNRNQLQLIRYQMHDEMLVKVRFHFEWYPQ